MGAVRILSCLALVGLCALSGCELDRTPRPPIRDAGKRPPEKRDAEVPPGTLDDCRCSDPECTKPACVGLANGEDCSTHSQCESGNCRKGLCCRQGHQCCLSTQECTSPSGDDLSCSSPETCDGKRGTATCNSFACEVVQGIDDDTACKEDVLAIDCGSYPSVYCNGARDQTVGSCATRCSSHDDCDDDGYCKINECVPLQEDGSDCTDARECEGDSCTQGICCKGGDCCRDASDCPPTYRTSSRCEEPTTCTGVRFDAECVDNVCGQMETPTDDDSDCDGTAKTCNLYASALCNGDADQSEPECKTSCQADEDCVGAAYCGGDGTCESDLADGESCTRDEQCENRCQNGFCCKSGDCCQQDSDCTTPRYRCTNAGNCTGVRIDQVCNSSKQCVAGSGDGVDDNAACFHLDQFCNNDLKCDINGDCPSL